MERFVRVDLPIDSPDNTLKLCKEIEAKHTLMGAGSPLTGFVDMVVFESKRAAAETAQKNAATEQKNSEGFYGDATFVCGISKGQNKQTRGTLYWYVLQVRDILLQKNRGVEQNLEAWDFNVVISQTGARRNVRVDIPDDKPETMVELSEAIIAKHTALGVSSPLTGNVDMADFGTKTAAARTSLDDWDAGRKAMQDLHGQALFILGYAKGQTSQTPDTLYYDIIGVRDRLLQVYQDKEETLTSWGFEVVVHGHSTGHKKGAGGTTAVVQIDVAMGMVGNIKYSDIGTTGEITSIDFEASGSSGKYYATEAINNPPAGSPAYDVLDGQKLSKTASAVQNELGLGDTKPYLNVQNTGATPGHYKVTFHFSA